MMACPQCEANSEVARNIRLLILAIMEHLDDILFSFVGNALLVASHHGCECREEEK